MGFPSYATIATLCGPAVKVIAGEHTIGLAIFATHPIQYQVPWFRALAAQVELEARVYYAMLPDAVEQGRGFGIQFKWDLPLLDGYFWQLLQNRSPRPSLDNFHGCDVRNIVNLLRQSRPKAALITGWNSLYLLQALLACYRLGIPTLVRGDSNVLAFRGVLRGWVQRQLIRRFSAFLAVGKLNRQLYEQAGMTPESIFLCPHFVDNEGFSAQAGQLLTQRSALRHHWNILDDEVCFLFVGKLIPKKRVMDFLAGIDLARRAGAKVTGLVVGTGEQMEAVRAFVGARRVPVTLAGFLNQSEVARAYAAADCLVLPSDFGETWGLVVNEAMACGLPAIVSDQVGCGPDLVTENETGWVFPMGDVAALGGCMTHSAADAPRLAAMGFVAQKRVLHDYSISRAVDGTMQAITWLMAGSRGAA